MSIFATHPADCKALQDLIAKGLKGNDIVALVGISTGSVSLIKAGRFSAERTKAESLARGGVTSIVQMSAQRAS